MPRKRKEDLEREMADGKIHKPHQRNAANARERSRMRVLSKAFSRLKTTLPWVPPDTKLSKLDTLRLASSYIAHLKQMLEHEETMHTASYIHPINLTWPFTFNGRSFGAPHNSSTMTDKNNGTGGNTGDINSNSNSSNSSCCIGDNSPEDDRHSNSDHNMLHLNDKVLL